MGRAGGATADEALGISGEGGVEDDLAFLADRGSDAGVSVTVVVSG